MNSYKCPALSKNPGRIFSSKYHLLKLCLELYLNFLLLYYIICYFVWKTFQNLIVTLSLIRHVLGWKRSRINKNVLDFYSIPESKLATIEVHRFSTSAKFHFLAFEQLYSSPEIWKKKLSKHINRNQKIALAWGFFSEKVDGWLLEQSGFN